MAHRRVSRFAVSLPIILFLLFSATPLSVAVEPMAPSAPQAGQWTWQAGGTFYDIGMGSTSSGWIVGAGGLILRTNDGALFAG